MRKFFLNIKYFDIPLLVTTALLVIVGAALLYAISLSGDDLQFFYRQLVFIAIGLALFVIMCFYDYQNLAKLQRFLYPALILSLVYILIFSGSVRGSSRWINLGFFNLQPAEFAKLILIIGLSRWLYLKRGQINSWYNILLIIIYLAIPVGLIMWQPDLGSAMIIIGIWVGVLLLSAIKKKYLVILFLSGAILSGLMWQFYLHDYQKTRIEVFLNPDLDPQGKGYNVRQAIISVGSGQWFGRGLGQGLQSQLKFLPERHTDFVFASVAEEIGFAGCALLLGLYVYLWVRLWQIARRATNDLAMYITSGVLWMFFLQVFINVAMNVGLMPVTGIPLPFLTYGGSSMVVSFIALGIVQNIVMQSRRLRF
jgi:rod shape determining protein RodA